MDTTHHNDRIVKVTLNGRLDTPGVGAVETRLIASLVPGGYNAVVDLSQVTFVASLGIRMLIMLANSLRTRKAALAVYGAQESVREVFEAVALGRILPLCDTEADAVAAVGVTPH